MRVTVWYKNAVARNTVKLHPWTPTGDLQEATGIKDGDLYRFDLEIPIADPSQVLFKLYFPDETPDKRWEADAFIRRVPRDASELWIFDGTGRCLTSPPGAPSGEMSIVVRAISKRYAGGAVHVWDPTGKAQPKDIAGSIDSPEGDVTRFEIQLEDWMRSGFHFKLRKWDVWEKESSNRNWAPCDGGDVWFKSGQLALRRRKLQLERQRWSLLHASAIRDPQVVVIDDNDDFGRDLAPTRASVVQDDPALTVSEFELDIYPDSEYLVRAGHAGKPPACIIERPFVRSSEQESPSVIVMGVRYFLPAVPKRSSTLTFVLHRNPSSSFGDAVPVKLRTGAAPEELPRVDLDEPVETVMAGRVQQGGEDTWQATLRLLPGVEHSVGLDGEWRADGAFVTQRTVRIPAAKTEAVAHTVDGISGVTYTHLPLIFQNVQRDKRQQLMAAAFTEAMIGVGIFGDDEMPHGTTFFDGKVWFVLKAPHAVSARVILFDEASGTRQPAVPMACTADLRYLWCAVDEGAAPHGKPYRFQLNDTEEYLDPASRWVIDQKDLNTLPNEGKEGAWSRVVDQRRLRQAQAGSPWQTMGWEALLIYEMHALRFAFTGTLDPPAFDRVAESLKGPNGYLHQLPVTAVELLPVHEFPSSLSWGYNPSLFFAIDSAYGGPEPFARMVRAAHDNGRAVLLDVVFNHMNQSSMQRIAKDMYVSGCTAWGDMVHYAHPACLELFRQALLYLWHTFDLDGFRFDCTEVIVNGHRTDTESAPYILGKDANGAFRTGAGKGWDFLANLHHSLQEAARAIGRPYPYLVGENDPNNWPMTEPRTPCILDGQWHFWHHYRLGDAAKNAADQSAEIMSSMNFPHCHMRPFFEAVRDDESHDSCSAQGGKFRISAREPYGHGAAMAKAIMTLSLLAKGVPMLFMGNEAGEELPFFFEFGEQELDNPDRYLRQDRYLREDWDYVRVLQWFKHIVGLRNDPAKLMRGDDDQQVGYGIKTVSFTRGWGRIFVIATTGTQTQQQDLGWLKLPGNHAYREIFNSTWDPYRVANEPLVSNPSLLWSGNLINLPSIGAIVLERC